MKTKEFSILLKAFMPAILSLLLVIGVASYFQHQTNIDRLAFFQEINSGWREMYLGDD